MTLTHKENENILRQPCRSIRSKLEIIKKASCMYTNRAIFKGAKSKANLNKALPCHNHKTPACLSVFSPFQISTSSLINNKIIINILMTTNKNPNKQINTFHD